jgi:hypothetical protein
MRVLCWWGGVFEHPLVSLLRGAVHVLLRFEANTFEL